MPAGTGVGVGVGVEIGVGVAVGLGVAVGVGVGPPTAPGIVTETVLDGLDNNTAPAATVLTW